MGAADSGTSSGAGGWPFVGSAVDPEGRVVRAVLEGPLAPWEVSFGDEPDSSGAVSERWLLVAVMDLYGLPARSRAPDWLSVLRDELAGVELPWGRRFLCPCCDNLTLTKPQSHELCEVCRWEDDLVQYRIPEQTEGANRPCSLLDARRNYAEQGFAKERSRQWCRPPRPEERFG